MKIESKLTTITPKLAQLWMAKHAEIERKVGHKIQRPLNEERVKVLSNEILAGKWKVNGDSIRFNCDGRILDGQHRLSAVIRADAPIEAFVIFGLSSDVFDTIDVGAKRSCADVLAMVGEKNTTTLAAAVAIAEQYCTEENIGNHAIKTNEILDVLQKHVKIKNSMYLAKSKEARNAPVPVSCMVGIHYLVSKLDEEKANEFFQKIVSGTDLEAQNPVLMLRNLIFNTKISAKASIRRRWICAITIKAWNAFYLGKKLAVLRFSETESFPKIQDFELTKNH